LSLIVSLEIKFLTKYHFRVFGILKNCIVTFFSFNRTFKFCNVKLIPYNSISCSSLSLFCW